jgi:hypothetical protein
VQASAPALPVAAAPLFHVAAAPLPVAAEPLPVAAEPQPAPRRATARRPPPAPVQVTRNGESVSAVSTHGFGPVPRNPARQLPPLDASPQ